MDTNLNNPVYQNAHEKEKLAYYIPTLKRIQGYIGKYKTQRKQDRAVIDRFLDMWRQDNFEGDIKELDELINRIYNLQNDGE